MGNGDLDSVSHDGGDAARRCPSRSRPMGKPCLISPGRHSPARPATGSPRTMCGEPLFKPAQPEPLRHRRHGTRGLGLPCSMPSTSDRGDSDRGYPLRAGMTDGGVPQQAQRKRHQRLRDATDTPHRFVAPVTRYFTWPFTSGVRVPACRRIGNGARSRSPMAARSPLSHDGENLGPDGDHADKQGNRGQCSSFLNDGSKHRVLHERKRNIVHRLFFCQAPVVGQFQLWRSALAFGAFRS